MRTLSDRHREREAIRVSLDADHPDAVLWPSHVVELARTRTY